VIVPCPVSGLIRWIQAEVERAGQGDAAGVAEGLEDTELVVLVGPLDLLVEPHGDLRLVGRGGDRVERAGGGRLVGALLDELRLREVVEGDVVDVTESHGLGSVGELGDDGGRTGRGDHAVRDVARHEDLSVGGAENGHDALGLLLEVVVVGVLLAERVTFPRQPLRDLGVQLGLGEGLGTFVPAGLTAVAAVTSRAAVVGGAAQDRPNGPTADHSHRLQRTPRQGVLERRVDQAVTHRIELPFLVR
jgi:hypothetical protein